MEMWLEQFENLVCLSLLAPVFLAIIRTFQVSLLLIDRNVLLLLLNASNIWMEM